MKLFNPNRKEEYNIEKIVYENAETGIICGTMRTPEWGNCFVKITNYGTIQYESLKNAVLKMAEEEVRSLEKASECSKAVPNVWNHWNDKKNKQYVIIMKKMPGYSLREWMDQRPAENLTAKDIFVRSQLIKQICEIMRDIHKKYPVIAHRDLKPENIFIHFDKKKKHWKISIIDFGCANLNYVRNVGTANYQAPEQFGRKNFSVAISSKTDIFAIGQIFYELLTGNPPVIGIDYTYRAGEEKWIKIPELPEYLFDIQGIERVDKLLKKMTLLKREDRAIYDEIVNELVKIRFK